MTNTDTIFKLLYAEQYVNYSFDTTQTTSWNARNIFHLFTRFDNFIFGHTKFRIKDSRIFNLDTSLYQEITFFDNGAEGCSNCLRPVEPITVCNTYTICDKCPFRTTSESRCCNPRYYTLCTTYWIDLGGGGGSGGGGEGGGGGGGGTGGGSGDPEWDEPCVEMRGTPQLCDGVTGWDPVDATPPYSLWGSGHFLTPYISLEDEEIINNWKAVKINTDGLDSCRKVMLNKMLSSTHALGRMLVKLDRAIKDSNHLNNFNLKYKIVPNLGRTALTSEIDYDAFSGTFSATISIDSGYVAKSTNIYISQYIHHETVHAYLTYIHVKPSPIIGRFRKRH